MKPRQTERGSTLRHRVAIKTLFSVAQLQRPSDLCAEKMFSFQKMEGRLVQRRVQGGDLNPGPDLGQDLTASLVPHVAETDEQ